MRTIRDTVTFLALILLSAPLIYGQDLSKYRNFSLGTSLDQVSKQIGANSNGPIVIHEHPAVIQELTSWSLSSSLRSSEQSDPAPQMIFGFYNGALYKIEVTYDQHATTGLTIEDMVRAVSALYGTATSPQPELNFPMTTYDGSKAKVIARWEDSLNSVSLFRSSILDYFGLVVLSTRVNAEAEAAIVESARLDKEAAPQKEAEQRKKEADSLELERQSSLKRFHP
jgi:hypothetical protein